MFYRYVNDKLKNKHEIEKLRQDNIEYNDDLEMAEIMNKHFHAVFTREQDWHEEEGREMTSPPINEISVTHEETSKLLADLDTRKSHGPDGIVNWILKRVQGRIGRQSS